MGLAASTLSIGLDAFQGTYSTANNPDRTWLAIRPKYSRSFDVLKIGVGFQAGYLSDKENTFFIVPDVNASYSLNKNTSAYVRVGGGYSQNSFGDLVKENRNLNDSLNLLSEVNLIDIGAGITGKLSSLSYGAELFTTITSSMHFYKNNSLNPQVFDVVYDSGNVTTFGGKLWTEFQPVDYFSLYFSIKANNYTTVSEQEAWHKPVIELTIHPQLRVDKFEFTPHFQLLSGIKAYDVDQQLTVTLDPVVELGVDMGYKINEKFGTFLRARNLLGKENERYLYYNTRSFDIKAGVFVKF
jgi:hypothetical protein